jgi:hypothetical protein
MKPMTIQDFTVTTADGTWLDFKDEKITSPEDIEEGMIATILQNNEFPNGGTPDGEYVMPDGAIWKFEKGKLVKKGEPIQDKAAKAGKKIVYLKFKGGFKIRAEKYRKAGKPVLGV